MEALTKLKQTSSVEAYKSHFEALSNQLNGLYEHHKLSCFLSGLRDNIQLPARTLCLNSIHTAYGLTRMQEECNLAQRREYK